MSSSGEGGWPWGNDSANALNSLGGASSAGGTLTGPVSNTSVNTFALDNFVGTDDQKMALALAAASAAGGGVIQLGARVHTFAKQWSTAYTAGTAVAVKIKGMGVAFNGAWGTTTAATVCNFTYSGAGAACIDMQHIGTIEITGIQLANANTGVPLFQTTNATPNIHDCMFSGGAIGTACTTDAIVLGGTTSSIGAGDTAAYQGYAGAVARNFFDGIRRVVLFQSAANAINITENTISKTCGSNLYMGACVEFASPALNTVSNTVRGNCFEVTYYPVVIKLTENAYYNRLGPNGFYDPSAVTSAYHWIGLTCDDNVIDDEFHTVPTSAATGAVAFVRAQAQADEVQSALITGVYSKLKYFYGGAVAGGNVGNYGFSSGTGFLTRDFKGNTGGWEAVEDTGSYTSMAVQTAAINYSFTCSITLGSPVAVSTTAAFVYTDIGLVFGSFGSNDLLGIITAVYGPSNAPAWFAGSPVLAGDIAIPSSANGHLYQCSTAGTTGSAQPTWPTGGGTVTDGTAVWTDLGTSATAAVVNATSTATGSGGMTISRLGAPLTMTAFSRHHVISTGSAPSWTPNANAGSGATSTVAAGGSDLSQELTLTTGTGPASGIQAVGTAAIAFGSRAPKCCLTPRNAAAAAAIASAQMWLVTTVSGWTLECTNALGASTAYIFDILSIE